jgi:hypothetical protein
MVGFGGIDPIAKQAIIPERNRNERRRGREKEDWRTR